MKRASNSPRLRRRKPETLAERTSAMTVAISPGASCADGLHVAAVFVAEGDVAQQVFHRDQTLGLQHGRAGRADSFDVRERGGEIHAVG